MRLGLAQGSPVLGDLDGNVTLATEMVLEARAEAVDLVVFPELFLSGYRVSGNDADLAVEAGDRRIDAIAAAGRDTTAVLIGFRERGPAGELYNSVAYLQAGAILHTHRKAQLASYDIWDEARYFTAGSSVRAFDSDLGRLAALICYDLWHPGLALVAIRDGAQMLLVPANSVDRTFSAAAGNEDQWRSITRFYASMFECFVVFVNRVGSEGELRFWGGSHVVDPRGRVVAEGPTNESALVIADIDLDEVKTRRAEVPLVEDSRLDIVLGELGRLRAQDLDR